MRVLILSLLPVAAEAVTIEDRRGPQDFQTIPQRVVALDWTMATQLLDLDLAPIGAPEIELYRDWVRDPAMPASVQEIGRRDAPDLETLARLRPDAIIGCDRSADDVSSLERIAPVLVFDCFSARHDNIAEARRIYLALGALFDRERLAMERLATAESEIAGHAADIAPDVAQLGTAAVVRLNGDATAWVYGSNSFAEAALESLGLSNTLPQAASRWGVALRPVEELASADRGALLAILPHQADPALFESPLWRFLPAVRDARYLEVDPVWSYGGALALLRHVRAFHAALSGPGA
nr:ABC transporter substrate-binding protein [Halovulum dunhuangense]